MSAPTSPPRDRELHEFLSNYFAYERVRRLRFALVHAVAVTSAPFAWSAISVLPPALASVSAELLLLALAGLAIAAAIEASLRRRMFRASIDHRRGAVTAVVLGLAAGAARGQTPPGPDASQAPAPSPRPFVMEGVEKIGLAEAFSTSRLQLRGWLDQSYTANAADPDDHANALRAFDDRADAYRFNQLALVVERPLADGADFDLGARVELLYGSDARFTQAAGLLRGRSDRTVQFDAVEFTLTARIPVGNGLAVRAGKCATPIGFEAIEAPSNLLFSHSFLFTFATPFTHTGVTLTYPLDERRQVYYAIYRGWDVWNDNNDGFSHLLGTAWKSADDRKSVVANLITGPEQDGDSSDRRTLVDLVGTIRWGDRVSTSLNADYAYEEHAVGNGPGRWWGVAAYATYDFDPRFAAILRTEYFDDHDGSRTGFTADLVELTVGVNWLPFDALRNFRLRPEIRWDHAFGDEPFVDGTRADQWTLALDLVFTF